MTFICLSMILFKFHQASFDLFNLKFVMILFIADLDIKIYDFNGVFVTYHHDDNKISL